MTTAKEELKKAVELAEAAVAGVKDSALRKLAFSRILETLLGGAEPKPAGRAKSKGATTLPASSARRSSGGPAANVEELIHSGFFTKPKQFAAVMAELEAGGHHLPRTTLSPTLLGLCRAKKLRRRKASGGGWEYSKW